MVYFKEGIIETTENEEDENVLSFAQLKGMIAETQWVEMIREYLRDHEHTINHFLFDYDFSLLSLSEKDHNSICKKLNEGDSIYFVEYVDSPGFIEQNWKVIAEYYYKKHFLDDCIGYMFTLSDGDFSIKCVGYK